MRVDGGGGFGRGAVWFTGCVRSAASVCHWPPGRTDRHPSLFVRAPTTAPIPSPPGLPCTPSPSPFLLHPTRQQEHEGTGEGIRHGHCRRGGAQSMAFSMLESALKRGDGDDEEYRQQWRCSARFCKVVLLYCVENYTVLSFLMIFCLLQQRILWDKLCKQADRCKLRLGDRFDQNYSCIDTFLAHLIPLHILTPFCHCCCCWVAISWLT